MKLRVRDGLGLRSFALMQLAKMRDQYPVEGLILQRMVFALDMNMGELEIGDEELNALSLRVPVA